jgi:hypothetical protein
MSARWTLALCIVLVAPALTGCIGSDDQTIDPGAANGTPSADLRCVGDDANASCNHDTLEEPKREGNEVTIAANPTDPENVVAGAKDYYPESAGDCVWDGI